MSKTLTIQTKPEPCLPIRGFAHHWIIVQGTPGDPYAEGHCKYCPKRQLFKMAWPAKLDWNQLKHDRRIEERRRFRARSKRDTTLVLTEKEMME